jgi:hypothetical protein
MLERGRFARALGLAYSFRVLGAALLALPVAAAVGASGIRSFPEGDAKLFERGGLYLVEVFASERALLREYLAPSVVLLLLTALAGVVPAYLLVRALRPPDGEAVSTGAGRSLRRLVMLALAAWTGRALLVLATLGLAMTAHAYFTSANDERLPELAAAIATLPGILCWACLSVLHDVAMLAVIIEGAAPPTAIAAAVEALRRKGGRLGALYAAAAFAALGVIGAAAALVSVVDVSQGGWRTLAVALTHQLVIVLLLVLRAAWLWSALGTRLPRPQSHPEQEPGQEPPVQAEAFL